MRYDRSLYHPDKALKRSGPLYKYCMDCWLTAWRLKGRGDSRIALINALQYYVGMLRKRQQTINKEAQKHKDFTTNQPRDAKELYAQYLKIPAIKESVQIRLAQYQVVVDWLIDTYELREQGRLMTDWRYDLILTMETSDGESVESMRSELIMRHAIKTYDLYGEKMYFVSPGLATELRNTSVKGMPEEFFQLPYPTVYLVCPEFEPFRIYHDADGWHDVEGVYLVEDASVTPRTVRVIVMGKPNENALHPEDDAFYHWSLFLKEGDTMEQCLATSFGTGDGTTVVIRTINGESERGIVSGSPEGSHSIEMFKKNTPQLRAIFKYAMNVVIYITHPDAEIAKFNLSGRYDDLRRRALKAQGKKRRKLFGDAKGCRSNDRILLGGSVVVSRMPKEATALTGTGTKRKMQVQTYVAGHWQRYNVGPRNGEQTKVYIRKRPYWKGPKDGPISSKVCVLK